MSQADAERIFRVGETDTVGPTFVGSDLPSGVTVSSGTVAVDPTTAVDEDGDTDGETGTITGMADTSDFYVGDPVTVSAGFATTGPFTILSKTATSITVDELSDSEESDVTVTRAAGLVLGSATALITAAEDGAYAWATAVRAGQYLVTFTVTFSDSKVLVRSVKVIVQELALETGALISIQDFKETVSGVTWQSEPRIKAIIEAVSAAISGQVGCDLLPMEDIEETKNGTGLSYLYLDHWPVTELTSVVEGEVTLVEDTDFYLDYDLGILWKLDGGKWTTRRRSIVVTYDAGYETVPADVKLAALIESARTFSMVDKQMWGESSRTEDSVSITINTDELLPATLETLGRYRRVQI